MGSRSAEPSGEDEAGDATVELGLRTAGEGDAPGTAVPQEIPLALLQRYEVQEQLGSGALGIVYAAWDPELERRVAIKLVLPKLRKRSRADRVRVRILREAQSLARLSHANVVEVYDVGRYDEEDGGRPGVFLVMELLEGQTLRAWLRSTRTDEEIVHVFTQAGNGLAAAHRENLVHRDFKPDNVMVTRDGTAKVLDFGLARVPDGSTESVRLDDPTEQPVPFEVSDEMARLTQTGVVLGTPRYMAPEQYADSDVGHAADQFAFCLAFLEALARGEVFRADSYGELATAKRQGDFALPDGRDQAPAWLRALLERGLHPNPSRRWPSMDALLAAVERGPSRGRWRMIAGAATAGSLAAGGVWLANDRKADCSAGADQLLAAWNHENANAIEAALTEAGGAFGARTWADVEPALDRYASSWKETYVESCLARNRAELSDRGFDRRMTCLRGREAGFLAALAVFTEADGTTAERAHEIVAAIPGIADCTNDAALEDGLAPPGDPQTAAAVASFRAELARATTLARAGRFSLAQERLAQLEGQTQAFSYPPLEAEYLFAVGRLQSESGEYEAAEGSFEQALLAAESHGHDSVAADSAIALLEVVGLRLARPDDALRTVGRAAALVDRLGNPIRLRSRLLGVHGRVLNLASRYDEANRALEAALDLLVADNNRSELELAEALSNLSANLSSRGLNDQAIARMREGLSIVDRVLGPSHPTTGAFTLGLAEVQYAAEDIDAARLGYHRAVQLFEKSLGAQHPRLVPALIGWGGVLSNQGDFTGAREAYERAMTISEAKFGPEHPSVARVLTSMSVNELRANNPQAAIELDQRALEIYEKSFGPEHHRVGQVMSMLGWHQRVVGETEKGRETLQRALEILEARVGEEHPSMVSTWMLLGYEAAGDGRTAEGERYFEKALAYAEKHESPTHPSVARALYGLVNIYQRRKEWARSEPLLHRVLSILVDLRETGSFRSRARARLRDAFWEQGKLEQAIAEAELAKEEIELGIGPENELAAVEQALAKYRGAMNGAQQ